MAHFKTKHGLLLGTLLFSMVLARGGQALAEETRTAFDAVPPAVQQALAGYTGNITEGTIASVWTGQKNGKTIYTGKVVDLDGSARTIDVDANGVLSGFTQQPPPFKIGLNFGRSVEWSDLPPLVRQTVAGVAGAHTVSAIHLKRAANGLAFYSAQTTNPEDMKIFVETTEDGRLLGVKRRED